MKLSKVIAVIALLVAPVANALDTDADQPVYIDSDKATYDEKAETSTYIGHVVATQGSIRVDSDQMIVYLKQGAIDHMIANGNLAKFKQLPAVGKEEMHGEGLIIEFYPEKNLMVFKQNATVWQGDAKQSSEYIEYDTKNSLLKAGENNSDGRRVHSVIQPKTATPANGSNTKPTVTTNTPETKNAPAPAAGNKAP